MSLPPAARPPVGPGSRVAERVAWFYAVYPAGRIITDLVTRAREVAVFRAAVYRDGVDAMPAATGWSSGNPAGGLALERIEEAAVGRALANLGFAVPTERRVAAAVVCEPPRTLAAADAPNAAPPARAVEDPELRLLVADLTALVSGAERYGVRPRRAARWRARLRVGADAPDVLREAERRLRGWIDRRRFEARADRSAGPA